MECLQILTSSNLVAKLDDTQKRALFRAVHALCRRVAYRERNFRAKAERSGEILQIQTPPSVALDELLANRPAEPDGEPAEPPAAD